MLWIHLLLYLFQQNFLLKLHLIVSFCSCEGPGSISSQIPKQQILADVRNLFLKAKRPPKYLKDQHFQFSIFWVSQEVSFCQFNQNFEQNSLCKSSPITSNFSLNQNVCKAFHLYNQTVVLGFFYFFNIKRNA